LSSAEAEEKYRMAAYSQRGVEMEASEDETGIVSVSSETTLEPISVDASESSDCSVCEETFAATSNDYLKEIPEIASSNEQAPVETSSLSKLIAELVELKLKDHHHHHQNGEDDSSPFAASFHHDTSASASTSCQLNLDEATSPSNNRPSTKGNKKAKQNHRALAVDAAQRQAAQMTQWQAAQMSQWRQLQAAQVAQWQAAQMQVAYMQAAQVHQWRMAQAAWAAQSAEARRLAQASQ